MSKYQTTQIVDLIRRGNEQGLGILYDQYSASLNGIIIRIIGSTSQGEEILQKTFLKIWNNIDQFDPGKSTLFTWMSTIARNAAIDQRRLKSFENQQKTDSIDSNVYHINTIETKMDGLDVQSLLKNIEPKHKEVLDHVYLQGYTHRETAELLGIPIGTVKTRLRLAILELRERLKKEKKLFLGLFLIIVLLMLLMI